MKGAYSSFVCIKRVVNFDCLLCFFNDELESMGFCISLNLFLDLHQSHITYPNNQYLEVFLKYFLKILQAKPMSCFSPPRGIYPVWVDD